MVDVGISLEFGIDFYPRYWKFLQELMNYVSSINIFLLSLGVRKYPGTGINTNSAFDVSILSLLSVWIVSPNILKCDVISFVVLTALASTRRMYAATST